MNTRSFLAVAFTMMALSTICLADMKVRSRQTVSGQSFENTTYIKGKRQRSETFGGNASITQCDLKRTVQLNNNARTYLISPFAIADTPAAKPTASVDRNGVVQTGGNVTTTVTTKDTGERKQMFGYPARRLVTTIETVSSPDACSKNDTKMVIDGWYIDAAFVPDCTSTASYSTAPFSAKGCRDKYNFKTVGVAKRGYPVYEKTTMLDGSGKETLSMVNEVLEFSKAELDMALFEIPAGYKEVSDATELYSAGLSLSGSDLDGGFGTKNSGASKLTLPNVNKKASPSNGFSASEPGPKKPGTIRIGLAPVATGNVGDGISAADLSAAVAETMLGFLKMPDVEVLVLQARLESSAISEADRKECDLVVFLNSSHKRGGGGFSIFKAVAPVINNAASMAGVVHGTPARTASAASSAVAGHIRNKDEITLDARILSAKGSVVSAKSFRQKAKGSNDDIVSAVVEQAAREIASAARAAAN